MTAPLFSVIIATYNRQELLPRAIDSVLRQTFRDFELIIVDNGSTDNTRMVARRENAPHVRYVLNPRPTKSCDAPRNLGIQMAKGKLVSFLDDDDIWYPDRLETVKRAFDAYPDVSAICHNENRNVNGRVEGILRTGPWGDDIYGRLLYEENCLSPSGTTVKADVLRSLNGFSLKKEFFSAADYDLWLRMAGLGHKIHFIREPLGESVVTGYNWSIRNPAISENVAFLVQTHILKHEKRPLMLISKKGMRRIFQLYAIAGRSYLRTGHLLKALKCFNKAAVLMIRRPVLLADLANWFKK